MEPERPSADKQEPAQADAAEHVAHAHHLLKGLRERLEDHPELDEAIETLEMALSKLALTTGGML
jgi:hypothetical protein